MQTVVSYHRPPTLDEAVALLNREGVRSQVLAGGTVLNASRRTEPIEVVDLQAIGLDTIQAEGDSVTIGAMVRLQDLIDHPDVPPFIGSLATREGPNTLRNVATVGGTVAAAHPDSELLAGLLVYDAVVTLQRPTGPEHTALTELLAGSSTLDGAVITTVKIATDGRTAVARTGRTPADTSIVAAVARRTPDGGTKLALTGVATTPILVDGTALDSLDPPGDFRGSAEYRQYLATTLAGRALAGLGEER